RRQILVPTLGQLPVLHPPQVIGKLRIRLLVFLEFGEPGVAQLPAALADAFLEGLAHAVGNEELRVLRPAVEALGQLDLLLAERLAMRLMRALLVRRAIADVAVDDDERGAIRLLLEDREGA